MTGSEGMEENQEMSQNKYWQIAAGSDQREYSQYFLKFGLAFVADDPEMQVIQDIMAGDRIILKQGMSKIIAVGVAVERDGVVASIKHDKSWLKDFDGWSLPAYCNVQWHVPNDPLIVAGLTRSTITRVHVKSIQDDADCILSSTAARMDYETEPRATIPVLDNHILQHLVDEGLRPALASDLISTFNKIRLLARYYYRRVTWEEVREHETRSFLILPLMIALGWTEQQMKIEYPVGGRLRADLVCFSRPFRGTKNDNEHCSLILESKGFSKGLQYAGDQARTYALRFPSCKRLVVSNGFCYKVFVRNTGEQFDEVAYLNILQPQDRYPLDPDRIAGCLSAFKHLMPAWHAQDKD